MARFRGKAVEINAEIVGALCDQWNHARNSIPGWVTGAVTSGLIRFTKECELFMETDDGPFVCEGTDRLIRRANGRITVCSATDFSEMYESIE